MNPMATDWPPRALDRCQRGAATRSSTAAHMMMLFAFTMKRATRLRRTSTQAISKTGERSRRARKQFERDRPNSYSSYEARERE